MKYYITKPTGKSKSNPDFEIIKVNEVDEANFIEDYGHLIVTSGATMQEAIINFGELKKKE